VDLNHRPRPYQLSPSNLRWRFTDCYCVDFLCRYRWFSPLRLTTVCDGFLL